MKRRIGVCLILVSVLLAFTLNFSFFEAPILHADTTSTTIQPSNKDATLDQANPDTNFGWTQVFEVKTETNLNSRGVVAFDLSSLPSDVIIISAKLQLYIYSGSASGRTYRVCRVTSHDWTDAGATWNKYDGTNDWDSAGGDFTTDYSATATVPASGWMEWEVANIVESWYSGKYSNYGFLIKDDSEDSGTPYYTNLASKEYDADETKRPKLTITYTTDYYVADAEPVMSYGTIESGAYSDTWSKDGVCQVLDTDSTSFIFGYNYSVPLDPSSVTKIYFNMSAKWTGSVFGGGTTNGTTYQLWNFTSSSWVAFATYTYALKDTFYWVNKTKVLTDHSGIISASGEVRINYISDYESSCEKWYIDCQLVRFDYTATHDLTVTACEYDNSTALKPTSKTYVGLSNSSGSFTKQADANSQAKFTGQSGTIKYWVLWENTTNTNGKVYEETITDISADITKNLKCCVYTIDFSSSFKDSGGVALYTNPSAFTLTFPNSTTSGSLDPSASYLVQNGTTTWSSITWQGINVVDPDVESFDPKYGDPTINCDVYSLDFTFKDNAGTWTLKPTPTQIIIVCPNSTQNTISTYSIGQAPQGVYTIKQILWQDDNIKPTADPYILLTEDNTLTINCQVWDLTLNAKDKYTDNNLNDAGYFLITFPNGTELARAMSVTGSYQFKAMNGSYTITTKWHGCAVNSSWSKSFDPSITSQNIECDIYTSLGTIDVAPTGNGTYLTKFNATSYYYCGNSSAPFTSGTFKVFDGSTEIASQSISGSHCIATSTSTLHSSGTLYFNVTDGVAYTRTAVSQPYNISVYGLSISHSSSITEGDNLPITFSWTGNASIDYPNYPVFINKTRICYQVWKDSTLRFELNSSLFALLGEGSNSTTLAISGLEAYAPYTVKAWLVQTGSEWNLGYTTGTLEVKEKSGPSPGPGPGPTPITVTGSTINVEIQAGTSQQVEIGFSWSGTTMVIVNEVLYSGDFKSWVSTQTILPKKFLRTAGATPTASANITVLVTVPMDAKSGSYTVPFQIIGADASSGNAFSCNGYIQLQVESIYEPTPGWEDLWLWILVLIVSPMIMYFGLVVLRRRS